MMLCRVPLSKRAFRFHGGPWPLNRKVLPAGRRDALHPLCLHQLVEGLDLACEELPWIVLIDGRGVGIDAGLSAHLVRGTLLNTRHRSRAGDRNGAGWHCGRGIDRLAGGRVVGALLHCCICTLRQGITGQIATGQSREPVDSAFDL